MVSGPAGAFCVVAGFGFAAAALGSDFGNAASGAFVAGSAEASLAPSPVAVSAGGASGAATSMLSACSGAAGCSALPQAASAISEDADSAKTRCLLIVFSLQIFRDGTGLRPLSRARSKPNSYSGNKVDRRWIVPRRSSEAGGIAQLPTPLDTNIGRYLLLDFVA